MEVVDFAIHENEKLVANSATENDGKAVTAVRSNHIATYPVARLVTPAIAERRRHAEEDRLLASEFERLFLPPGQITELRAFDAKIGGGNFRQTYSGYFDDSLKLYQAARSITAASGIHFIPNVVAPDLISRANNRLRSGKEIEATSDKNIIRRRWFLVDADPIRLTGISSTDGEHDAAIAKVFAVADHLASKGWPAPVIADSGNGAHLLYRVDEQVNDDHLFETCLKALAAEFSDAVVEIDKVVFNPARLWKLYGTMACKGDSSSSRPHRKSKIINAPDHLLVVSREQLDALAATAPRDETSKPARVVSAGKKKFKGKRTKLKAFDIDGFIREHNVPVGEPQAWEAGGRRWVFDICPWNSEHRNGSAFIVQFSGGAISAGCHHNSCASNDWRSLREMFDPGHKLPKVNCDGARESSYNADAGDNDNDEEDSSDLGFIASLAACITSDTHFAQDAGGKLFRFVGGVYRGKAEEYVRRMVKFFCVSNRATAGWKTKEANEVVEFIRVDSPNLWTRPPSDVVNVENGLLNLRSGELSPHSHEHLCVVQLPIVFDPSATCPTIDKFVSQVFPADATDIAYEIPGWLMAPSAIQKAILLMGEGANGKSRYLAMVRAFVGSANCSALSLHKIEEDRFACSRLLGKLANICPDLPTGDLESTSTFKALTGGDTMVGEYKFKESFDFDPYVRLVFSANSFPRSADSSPGFFRRWLVVPFERTFYGTERIDAIKLDEMLSQPTELSGLLNKAMLGWRHLTEKTEFTETASIKQGAQELRATTDPLAVWLDRCTTTENPDGWCQKGHLIGAYGSDCGAAGRHRLSANAFGRRLKTLRPTVLERQRSIPPKNNRVWTYEGISIVPGVIPEADNAYQSEPMERASRRITSDQVDEIFALVETCFSGEREFSRLLRDQGVQGVHDLTENDAEEVLAAIRSRKQRLQAESVNDELLWPPL